MPAVLRGERSGGRPQADDAADLAAIEGGESLSDIAKRRADAIGEKYASNQAHS
jgi:hypothetical protein